MDVRFKARFKTNGTLKADFGNVTEIHTDDYNGLTNKPKINNRTVEGDKLGSDYNLQDKMDALSVQEIEKILSL